MNIMRYVKKMVAALKGNSVPSNGPDYDYSLDRVSNPRCEDQGRENVDILPMCSEILGERLFEFQCLSSFKYYYFHMIS
jgi:hypothetical protein